MILGAHNFLDAAELHTLNLPLDTSQILEVKVVDGNIIKTLGVCHGVTVIIQGFTFVVDFNVLHLRWVGGWVGGGGGGVYWSLALSGYAHWVLLYEISSFWP